MNTTGHGKQALRAIAFGIVVNAALALVKGISGYVGNSYALIADAIESTSDIFTSGIVFFGVKMAGKPADKNHPYGHGKFEPLAAMAVSLILGISAIAIAIESIREILTPHHAPAPFTLMVLPLVVIIKEFLFRRTKLVGADIGSIAVNSDAWHHRSDAITSAAAFIGIAIAVAGGPGYESADDYAALFAAAIIAINAFVMLKPALAELIDTAPDPGLVDKIRAIAVGVSGVLGTHKCHVRKLGYDYFVDLDILCNPVLTIREGHDIAHDVCEAIRNELPQITRTLVHVEPADDYGRRSSEV